MTALAFYSSQGMSASPLFEMYRIECRDYSERMKRVRITPTSLRRAGRARLRASSSTEQPRGGWLIRPLSRAGKAQFTGRGRQSNYALQSSFGPANLRRALAMTRLTKPTAAGHPTPSSGRTITYRSVIATGACGRQSGRVVFRRS
jgi:hypothetical protein